MSKIEDQLKDLADKAYVEKVAAEKSTIEERYLKDKTQLIEIIGIVKQRLVYKEVGEYQKKYVVVTEKMLFEDYTNAPANRYSGGIAMKSNGRFFTITINGHHYYHLGELFRRYRETVEKAIDDNSWEREKLYEKRDRIKSLETQEPKIKKMLIDFTELEERHKEEW